MKIKDLRVLEIASVLAGPAVGMFFSELGAKVIKIENKSQGGDVTRKWKLPSELANSPTSAYYHSVNWNKETHFLDFNDQVDREFLISLIKESDLVISNFKKGDDVKFNLTFEDLKLIQPKIILGTISGFGEESPRMAFDVVLQAETGYISMTGDSDSNLAKLPVAFIDLFAAHQLKEGLLLALLEETKPCHVSVSLYDAAIASLANQASNYLNEQFVPKPMGTKHPNIAPYGDLLETKDQNFIVLAVGNNKQFESLLKVLGLPVEEEFNTNLMRVKNRARLIEKLNAKTSNWKRKDLLEELEKNNVPAGGVYSLDRVFENENAQKLILNETTNKIYSRRVRTTVFKTSF